MALPLKLFEIQEVVLKDETQETGARNERRLAAIHYNNTPGFEVKTGCLQNLDFTKMVSLMLDVGFVPLLLSV